MRTHIIKEGKIINTIVATVEEAQVAFPDCTVAQAVDGAPGWDWDGAAKAPNEPSVQKEKDNAISILAGMNETQVNKLVAFLKANGVLEN